MIGLPWQRDRRLASSLSNTWSRQSVFGTFQPANAGNARAVRASWTYQVPPAGAGATGLEDYQVETSDGAPVGKVLTILEREGDRYVVLDTGVPPVSRERRAVPWEKIDAIDHDALTVRIQLGEGELENAIELDPKNQVEDGDADAMRVTQLPGELTPTSDPDERGPIDRPSYAAAIALFAVGLLGLLALALAAGSTPFTWEFALFGLPLVLFVASGILAYRTYRRPYER
jgi:hypothetical protein